LPSIYQSIYTHSSENPLTHAQEPQNTDPAPVSDPAVKSDAEIKDGFADALFKAAEELSRVAAAFTKATARLSRVAAAAAALSKGPAEVEEGKGEGQSDDAVVAPAGRKEVKAAHEEMSNTATSAECPFLMNKECVLV
jgi:hypothetical protein